MTASPQQLDDAVLPDPELVAETFERMRASVLRAYARHEADKTTAQQMVEDAEREQDALRTRYPMFFPEEERPRRARAVNPDAGTVNRMLRTLAEHPNQSRKQLARRLGHSESWINRIILYTNESLRGDMIAYTKQGRARHYFLTEAGRRLLDSGGVRA